jgi:adenosine deaminase
MPLPKAELHLHIEGTLEPEFAFRLAARNRITLPYRDVEELSAKYDFQDLQSFLDLYYATMDVLRTEQDFTDLADAYLARARQQGVRHAEIFFDPQAHTSRGVPFDTVIKGLQVALADSQERHGVSTRLILCFLRDHSPESAMEILEQALAYRDLITGVGLDSAEVGYPPSLFRDVFARARDEGLHCVAHAGEEGPPEYIWEALDLLGVERVDHGVRCLEDSALVERLRSERIPLTVCPLSNVRLRVVPALAQHPLPAMLDAGLLVTINSDDPAYFGGYVEDNFEAVRKECGLTQDALRSLAAHSIKASYLDETQREALLGEIDEYRFPSA